ncbi:ferric-chelate reductase [Tilletia horrida]|nr:ferric-chelate reductase [Tilletia horrida]
MDELRARHIQDFHGAANLQHHWGYADRVIPCTNDPGSCEYLDVVYSAHDRGMIYVAIIWATIIVILTVWGLVRLLSSKRTSATPAKSGEDPTSESTRQSTLSRISTAIGASARHYLLPDIGLRRIFGRVTRLQVLILATLVGYLIIWSFLGMTYRAWTTPVKKLPGVYNRRTSLGPFADRLGVLAYALTPLSILLASRESVLALITGVPYHHFNFLHRWLGHIIFVQASVHTIGWCIIEARLYQPQPQVGREWISQTYMVWGIVAMILLTMLWVLSLPISVRTFGYEFFRKAHYVLAMVYIGACYGHWDKLRVFLIPSLGLWGIDRGLRLVRSALLHYNCLPASAGELRGFHPAPARIAYFPDQEHGDVVRLDFELVKQPWSIGQHFYLCFTEGSIWQSHPLTPLSLPELVDGTVLHSYIFRAKQGETKRIAQLAADKCDKLVKEEEKVTKSVTTGVILTGPYGGSIMEQVTPGTNILCLAGGTGITFVLPVLLRLAKEMDSGSALVSKRAIELCWMVRRASDVNWVQAELEVLRRHTAIKVRVFVTRDGDLHRHGGGGDDDEDHSSLGDGGQDGTTAAIPTKDDPNGKEFLPGVQATLPSLVNARHPVRPDVGALVRSFVQEAVSVGETTVFVSGPGGMVSDARAAVAGCNSGRAALAAQTAGAAGAGVVRFVDDDRLEF